MNLWRLLAPLVPAFGVGAATSDNKQKVHALQRACEDGFNDPSASKSCSHAVWVVLRKMKDPNEEYRQANQLIEHMSSNWKEVTLEDGWKLANQGVVVVGGLKDTNNGHVVVIYPGDKIASGGYQIPFEDPITKKKGTIKMRSHGDYPRCMSRSMGSWPGGVSNGSRTVFDAFGSDKKFAKVKYWTPKSD